MLDLSPRVSSLEANFLAIDRRAQDHEKNDNERFERHMDFSADMKKDILSAISQVTGKVAEMDDKLDALWDEKNERRGASRTGKYLIGAAGSVIGGVIALLGVLLKKG